MTTQMRRRAGRERDLTVTEAPGGLGPVALCPNCSMGYTAARDERDPKDQSRVVKVLDLSKVPDYCERCDAPMDRSQLNVFQTGGVSAPEKSDPISEKPELTNPTNMTTAAMVAELEERGVDARGVAREELIQLVRQARQTG